MDTALGHARIAFGLSWVAADKDKRIYAYNGKPYRKLDVWLETGMKDPIHIGAYTGTQSWRKTKRGQI